MSECIAGFVRANSQKLLVVCKHMTHIQPGSGKANESKRSDVQWQHCAAHAWGAKHQLMGCPKATSYRL